MSNTLKPSFTHLFIVMILLLITSCESPNQQAGGTDDMENFLKGTVLTKNGQPASSSIVIMKSISKESLKVDTLGITITDTLGHYQFSDEVLTDNPNSNVISIEVNNGESNSLFSYQILDGLQPPTLTLEEEIYHTGRILGDPSIKVLDLASGVIVDTDISGFYKIHTTKNSTHSLAIFTKDSWEIFEFEIESSSKIIITPDLILSGDLNEEALAVVKYIDSDLPYHYDSTLVQTTTPVIKSSELNLNLAIYHLDLDTNLPSALHPLKIDNLDSLRLTVTDIDSLLWLNQNGDTLYYHWEYSLSDPNHGVCWISTPHLNKTSTKAYLWASGGSIIYPQNSSAKSIIHFDTLLLENENHIYSVLDQRAITPFGSTEIESSIYGDAPFFDTDGAGLFYDTLTYNLKNVSSTLLINLDTTKSATQNRFSFLAQYITDNEFEFYGSTDQHLVLEISGLNSHLQFESLHPVLIADQWQHIGFSFDQSTETAKLFVDGISIDLKPTQKILPLQSIHMFDFIIGNNNDISIETSASAKIDELRIWESTLSESQMKSEVNSLQDL
jgi:hypothetical protein